MEFSDLHLDAQDFKEAPTKTQIINLLHDVEKFLARVGAALMLDGSYRIGEQSVGTLLNATIQLRAAADAFEQGPNSTGLAVPQPGPVPIPGRR